MAQPRQPYPKSPLSLDDQVQRLLDRGLIGDPGVIRKRLAVVGYYRLSAYWHPFRLPDLSHPGQYLDEFEPGTSFEEVWARYAFDRRLRLHVLDAIERIEVAARAMLAQEHTLAHGRFAYMSERESLSGLSDEEWAWFVESVQRACAGSKEPFVLHFRRTYSDSYLPLWIATEIVSLGCIAKLFNGVSPEIQRTVAASFGISPRIFGSWLRSLNVVRNTCAHHSRLWNRVFGFKPRIPDADPQWHHPVEVSNDRVFAILTISKYCLNRIAPQSRWDQNLRRLLADFPTVPTRDMGFPDNWQTSPIWTLQGP